MTITLVETIQSALDDEFGGGEWRVFADYWDAYGQRYYRDTFVRIDLGELSATERSWYQFVTKSTEDAIAKCKLITKARQEGRKHVSGCCPLAMQIHCVCIKAHSCPLHGESHRGTHD